MHHDKSSIKKRHGTSFKGYVLVTYQQLVGIFGVHTTNGDGYKTDAEWIIDTPFGVATIYNYKNGKAYLGDVGLGVREICEWHVGGKNTASYNWVRSKIQQTIIDRI